MMKIEEIVLWILIAAIVVIALWLLSGFPPTVDALITLVLFAAASELLIWRNMFSIENNTSVGFMKVKHGIERMRIEMNNKLDKIEGKL